MRRATVLSLCRYFLEGAWNHAEALGFGFSQLGGQNKYWVLSRLLVQVREYPVWGGSITLRTWPRDPESLFAPRDFEFTDKDGKVLAAGSSAWLVLDSTSKRPQRLSKVLPQLSDLSQRSALDRDPQKLAPIPEGEKAFSALAHYTDIDVNRHVNSVRYIGWMLDSYPTTFHAQHSVRLLEVNFLGETLEGDAVSLHTGKTGPGSYCHELRKNGGEQVCRAVLEWTQ